MIKPRIIYTFFAIVSSTLFLKCSIPQASQQDLIEITSTLMEQQDAWNEGNLEKYMQGYWKSDSLKFLSSSKVTYGWQQTLEKYKKTYPDARAMGKLTFEILKIELLEKNSVLLIGKYHVTREEDELKGFFSLIWKKIDGKWVIIFDHSS